MESGPAIFAGTVFALFGAAMLAWVANRVPRREPVAAGVGRAASATLATLAALASLTAGAWCFARL
ncbi:hypothetical protein [Streptomyces sp. NPDC093260]|uniref:hypothetical protein n=1 Tax=Streptomyces sp. NPDC093260 TaxID=3155073 RepID=UPI0034321A52